MNPGDFYIIRQRNSRAIEWYQIYCFDFVASKVMANKVRRTSENWQLFSVLERKTPLKSALLKVFKIAFKKPISFTKKWANERVNGETEHSTSFGWFSLFSVLFAVYPTNSLWECKLNSENGSKLSQIPTIFLKKWRKKLVTAHYGNLNFL